MIRTFANAIVVLASLCAGALPARDEVPTADRPELVPRGATALLESAKGMHYFLRVPRSYDPKRGARLVVFMHGSNMHGLSYLRSFEQRGWANDAVLVCPNGEEGEDPYGSNNFTFGSAPFVAEVTEDVQKAFRVTKTYIGGHSQGGFVTYSVIMLHPDLFDGAFPMAGDCWMQNEPNLWEDKPGMFEKQKRIAIAVIHGRNDPVVSVSQGEHAYEVFVAMGYPKLRFLAPERLGHQFMLSPVDDALEWLDAMSGLAPQKSMQLAGKWAKEGEWGWAIGAARALAEAERVPSSARNAAKKILKAAEIAAKKKLEEMARSMEEDEAKFWLPGWFEFRRKFGTTDTAAPLVEKYLERRAKQRQEGKRLFGEARSLLRSDRKDEGQARLRELLEKAPATYEAYYALEWLEE